MIILKQGGARMQFLKSFLLISFICCILIQGLGIDNKAYGQDKRIYRVGIEDVLNISILQPQQLEVTLKIAPDGSINFPHIGMVYVKGLTLSEIQEKIQEELADGYMNYPAVTVSLKESQSRKFFVYGEVMKPGTYLLDDSITVLRAIAMAGGLSKYGSSSKIKILRHKKDGGGYETLKININAIMNGNAQEDILLEAGDMIVVSEGIF